MPAPALTAVSEVAVVVRHRVWVDDVPSRSALLASRGIALGEALVLGRADGPPRPGFLPWPEGPAPETVSREALTLALGLDGLQVRLGGAFRGSRWAPAPVLLRVDGVGVGDAAEVPTRVGRAALVELERAVGTYREVLALEVRVAERAPAGRVTVPAASPAQVRAREALAALWWERIAGTPSGRLVREGIELVLEERAPGDTDPEAARAALAAAVKNPERLREHIARAVERLRTAPADVPELDWQAHLHAYALDAVHDGVQGFGRTDLFLELCRRLLRVGLD